MAGLNIFWPRPPNKCLATTMAKNIPIKLIHQGATGEIHKANKMAVTSAEQSFKNKMMGLFSNFKERASKTNAKTYANLMGILRKSIGNHFDLRKVFFIIIVEFLRNS